MLPCEVCDTSLLCFFFLLRVAYEGILSSLGFDIGIDMSRELSTWLSLTDCLE